MAPQPHREDAGTLLRALDAVPATVVALDLAIYCPELVSSLVLDEPPLHLKRRPGPRMLHALMTTQIRSRVKDNRAATEAFFRWAFRYTSSGTGYDRMPDAVRETLLSNGAANMAELSWSAGEHLTAAQLARIDCPTVLLAGELSERSLARATRYTGRLVPHSRIKPIAGAGHASHLERPEQFATVIQVCSAE